MAAGPRVVDVTSHTTLDLVEAAARGNAETTETYAVADVCRPDRRPDVVRFDVELDRTDLEESAERARSLYLSPGEARTLADALADAADEVADD